MDASHPRYGAGTFTVCHIAKIMDRSGSSWLRHALIAVCCIVMLSGKSPAQAKDVSPLQSVIIDTDIGGDIDDVYAVSLALQSRELKVLGIMTEFEETLLEARLASRFFAADQSLKQHELIQAGTLRRDA